MTRVQLREVCVSYGLTVTVTPLVILNACVLEMPITFTVCRHTRHPLYETHTEGQWYVMYAICVTTHLSACVVQREAQLVQDCHSRMVRDFSCRCAVISMRDTGCVCPSLCVPITVCDTGHIQACNYVPDGYVLCDCVSLPLQKSLCLFILMSM